MDKTQLEDWFPLLPSLRGFWGATPPLLISDVCWEWGTARLACCLLYTEWTDCSIDSLIRNKPGVQVMGHGNGERLSRTAEVHCCWFCHIVADDTDIYRLILIVLLNYHPLFLWYSLVLMMRVFFLWCLWGIKCSHVLFNPCLFAETNTSLDTT